MSWHGMRRRDTRSAKSDMRWFGGLARGFISPGVSHAGYRGVHCRLSHKVWLTHANTATRVQATRSPCNAPSQCRLTPSPLSRYLRCLYIYRQLDS